jgi:hypothetical protein
VGGDGHTHHWVLSVASQQRHELNYSGLLVTLVVLLCLVGPSCNKAETTEPSDLTVVIQTPRSSFVFGQPIHLNVLFRNNLERTITVPGFNPEGLGGFGRSISVSALKYDEAKDTYRCVRESAFQLITTSVSVTRISGTANDSLDVVSDSMSETRSRNRSVVLKPGETAQYSFELLDTLAGGTINAPGHFSVSIAYKVKTRSSSGFVADGSEWSGEIHSEAVPISVVSK